MADEPATVAQKASGNEAGNSGGNAPANASANVSVSIAGNSPGEAPVPALDIARELANLRQGLSLLGVKPCSACGKFYLGSDPGNLFTVGGDTVCYGCLSSWWPACCGHLDAQDRETIEYRLKDWLVKFHHARVCREAKELPAPELQDLRLVVGCRECKGSGIAGGERCRHCLGNRTVWVVTLK